MQKPALFYMFACAMALAAPEASRAATYYVDFALGSATGDGSAAHPWESITTALDGVPDGSLVLVRPGLYAGRVRIRGTFAQGVTVRAEPPYRAQLRNNAAVITAYQDSRGCQGITLEGFDVAHGGPGASALVVHIDGGGSNAVSRLTLRNNVLHDSYNNDILKINNSTSNITVEGNVFYNQTGSDEHIDINSTEDIVVQDNIFFNDFAGSGRQNNNDTSSFIVIKDSNGSDDAYLGSRRITVRRNIFLNWEGNTGSNFILLGEDGQPFYEAADVLIENNLLLGNSVNVMRAAFGVKGGRDITFRHNTVSGDLPALAFAMRLNREGSNPVNENIQFFNNIWSDPRGSMGARSAGDANDFSDTPAGQTASFLLRSNLYWNGGAAIPADAAETINYTADERRIVADPLLGRHEGIVLPRWNPGSGRFGVSFGSIPEAFRDLVLRWCNPGSHSPALNTADPAQAAEEDIMQNRRAPSAADLGACERAGVPPSAPGNLRPAN